MNSEQLAWRIRRHGIEMTHISEGSHIGAILSVADIIAVLYSNVLRYDSQNPKWEERDRFILSKGHAGAAVYAALAECGFFPLEELKTHYANGSRLSGHVSHHVPGVDFSTGSLGHGLSAAAGMAYVLKKECNPNPNRVYVVIGDGECDEGSVWEAALFANHYRLDNLIAVIDHNRMQSLDFCENTLELKSLADKWKSFGWNVKEINGNNHDDLKKAYLWAQNTNNNKPAIIIAKTVKGCGVSFMQDDILWHYRYPHDGWEYDCAVNELYKQKPKGIKDPYTPEGIKKPAMPDKNADIGNNHTLSYTWNTSYPR